MTCVEARNNNFHSVGLNPGPSDERSAHLPTDQSAADATNPKIICILIFLSFLQVIAECKNVHA